MDIKDIKKSQTEFRQDVLKMLQAYEKTTGTRLTHIVVRRSEVVGVPLPGDAVSIWVENTIP